MDMSEPLRVDVVFDFVCPWCYIGKRRLEAALEDWTAAHPGGPKPVVRWLPFQLNPEIPTGGMSRREHQDLKHGPAGPDLEKQAHVAALAKGLGLALELDKITVQPNTLDAHRLSGSAQKLGRQDEMVEALLKAFFMQGVSLNDHEALADLASTMGLDWSRVAEYLMSDTDVKAVERLEQQVRTAGIEMVPFFIFNGKVTVEGAHEVKVLLEAMQLATTDETTTVA